MELEDKLAEKEDLLSALQNMGFRRKEAERAVGQTIAATKPGTEFDLATGRPSPRSPVLTTP